jgi:hypothetical protein
MSVDIGESNMMNRLYGVLVVLFAGLTTPFPAVAAGPDVIVGFVDDGREDSRLGGKIGLTASTNSCNIGDASLNWYRLPDARHPAITLNFYRLLDGRIEQLARSWGEARILCHQSECVRDYTGDDGSTMPIRIGRKPITARLF